MCHNATGADKATEVAVDPADGGLRKPMQGRRGDDSIELLIRLRLEPRRLAEIGSHNPHAVVTGEGGRRDGEQHRVDIQGERTRGWQPVEQAARNRARATAEIKHGRRGARYRLNDIDQRPNAQLSIGHQIRFETVPGPLPSLGPRPGRERRPPHGTMLEAAEEIELADGLVLLADLIEAKELRG
jgi:hypothetical protein